MPLVLMLPSPSAVPTLLKSLPNNVRHIETSTSEIYIDAQYCSMHSRQSSCRDKLLFDNGFRLVLLTLCIYLRMCNKITLKVSSQDSSSWH